VKWVANGTADGGAHYIRGVVMGGFAELVGGAGGDPVALAEKAGFSRDVLSEPDGLISWARLGVLMDLAAEEIGRPSFGLDWAASLPSHFPNVGPVALMAYFVETAREWVEAVIQYWRYHTNALTLQLLDDPTSSHIIFRYRSESLAPATRQQMEYMLGTACRMARAMTDRDENPTVVRFKHGRPVDTAQHDAGVPSNSTPSRTSSCWSGRCSTIPPTATSSSSRACSIAISATASARCRSTIRP
jgi:hypothetical protein